MTRIFSTLLSAAILLLLVAAPASAVVDPRPIPTDSRIRTVVYNPNEVYRFTAHYGYQSSIEFSPDEEIVSISIGDSSGWMVNPTGSRIFLKPILQNATTNMTVITNSRTYYFELHPAETDNIQAKDMIFALRFIYPDTSMEGGGGSSLDPVPDPAIDTEPEKYNFNYTLTGSEMVSPIRIFDDGQFTYFEFRDKNADVPAFFLVNRDGSEQLINFRTRGNYIVVERVASQFTLRHGSTDIVCIYNEARPLNGKPKEK